MLAKIISVGCLLAAFSATPAIAQSVYRDIVVEENEREPAPNFHAKTLTGEQFNNESTKGKVVLFQFWATWCRYCQSEESLVNDIATEFADQGLIVMAVDVGESKKVVQQYLKDHPRKCHIVLTGDTNLAAMYAATRTRSMLWLTATARLSIPNMGRLVRDDYDKRSPVPGYKRRTPIDSKL